MNFRKFSNFYVFIMLAAAAAVVSSCSTKKNTFTSRAFHNLNTHYNVYWNGNESFKAGKLDLEKSVLDNYNTILPVYNFGTPENARRIYSQMDKSIEKAGIAIQKHSMFFRNVEYNKWIDDCYMLMGKAQFYKQDFASARRTMEFVMKQYTKSPLQYEASMWLIRSYLQQKRLEDATAQLEQLDIKTNKKSIPYRVRREIPLVYADYYLQANNTSAAKTYLKQGLELASKPKMKARLNFILGQIAQRERNYSEATEYYTKVIKSPAPFEMVFNARMNLAKSFDRNSGNENELVKQLKKMLRDSKNIDYNDQIYYALAEMAQVSKNDTLVAYYLKKSVASSVKNDFQKSTSALQLADLYFKNKNYEPAAAYYDTVTQTLPKEHPNYDAVLHKSMTLTELVGNLQTIQHEDSLQRLAKLPDAELAVIINKIIEKVKAEEQAKRDEEERQRTEAAILGNVPNLRYENVSAVGGGGWYFYNTSAISLGYTDFLRKWGRRKLEDNWRLSNKKAVMTSDDFDTESATTDSVANPNGKTAAAAQTADPLKPESYIQQLPKTKEQLAASNKLIAISLLNLGYLYRDGLNDMPNSVKSFEDLITRFPDMKDNIRIYYQLYLLGLQIPDEELSSKYKKVILDRFGETDYAQIIRDPDYNKEVLAKKNRALAIYEETYNAFTRGQYKMVLLYCNKAITDYKDKDLIPRFEYLRALSLGKTIGTDTMVVMLNKLITKYATHEVTPLAQDMVALYTKTPEPQPKQPLPGTELPGTVPFSSTADTIIPDIYKFNAAQSHFYLMLADEKTVNVNAVKNRMSDFITKNFNPAGLTVNSIVLDGGWQMITVSSFRDSQAAMDFYKSIGNDNYVMAQIDQNSIRQMVISMENYPVFYREKKYDGYLNFFRKYYH